MSIYLPFLLLSYTVNICCKVRLCAGKINGSATSLEDLKIAIKQADAVIIAIGSKKKKGTSLFSNMAPTFKKADTNLRFTAAVPLNTGFGAGDSRNYLILFMQTGISLF